MAAPVRLLILGTGNMGRTHVEAYKQMENVEIVAGVDARPDALNAFCDEFGIAQRYHTLDEAILQCDFDAASNVTPDAAHYATSMSLLASGKHVLCEKPLTTDFALALEMVAAAQAAGKVNMLNLSYRNVPALQAAAKLVADGAIGEIRHFDASYLQSWLTQPAWGDWKTDPAWLWRLSTAHGSKGVLGDVGIHIIDYATFIAGLSPVQVSARLKTFHKAPFDRIGDYPLDANDSAVMHLELENGALGTISATRFASGHHNDLYLRIYGDLGALEVSFEDATSVLRSCIGPDALLSQTWSDVACPPVPTVYERFISAIQNGTPSEPDFKRGAQLQEVLDLAQRSDELESRALHINPVDPNAAEPIPRELL
ncbi:putative oxidoreductase YcjS [Aquimixticola soesokkakensis]|uniref:Putative oxidoreductase YcjS n=1 Tax=Aquimixticola soesokkakensis TaxID=1519096 RepID=A0A1Y5TI11_9RHOB|nr:Gfo/Idh/MocA family oxidoreductase [Aquimixticola soesokkakensis]SLN60782.1 putative oxidoreductase YcjS [Aquimixticola soesokkakensis]